MTSRTQFDIFIVIVCYNFNRTLHDYRELCLVNSTINKKM